MNHRVRFYTYTSQQKNKEWEVKGRGGREREREREEEKRATASNCEPHLGDWRCKIEVERRAHNENRI
jgi:hypothetical protein